MRAGVVDDNDNDNNDGDDDNDNDNGNSMAEVEPDVLVGLSTQRFPNRPDRTVGLNLWVRGGFLE